MFQAINKWPVLDQINRPRIGTFIGEIDDIFSGQRNVDPTIMEPIQQPVLIPRTNLMACSSATHLPSQPVTLRNLLQSGSTIHERDPNGDTCLHAALLMSRPEQPWVVQSMSTLMQAGADPRQRNHAGYTVYDIACDGPPELGSFRKDLLLQAMLECGRPVEDDRVLAPRWPTQYYTTKHHEMICGGYAAQEGAAYRKALSDRLRNYVEYHRVSARPSIQAAAVERIMSSEPSKWTSNPDATFHEVLEYLQRIIHGKTRVVAMRRERLPTQIWEGLQGQVDWPQMVEHALTVSILEFDWFRPVDAEDVFLSHVDNLIEQLEDLDVGEDNRAYINHLIQVLQNSIPSYRAVSLSSDTTNLSPNSSLSTPASSNGSPRTERSSTLSVQTPATSPGILAESDIGRKESIAKTPAEYYPPELRFRSKTMPVEILRPLDSSSASDASSEHAKRQKWRFGTKKRKP
jgi:hypothetical protein